MYSFSHNFIFILVDLMLMKCAEWKELQMIELTLKKETAAGMMERSKVNIKARISIDKL